jgi:methyl-accepting chemotaxis protein
MIARLQNESLIPFILAVVLLISYTSEQNTVYLLASGLYIGVGVASIAFGQQEARFRLIALGIASAFGVISMAASGLWVAWVGISIATGWSLTVYMLHTQDMDWRYAAGFAFIIVVSLFIAESLIIENALWGMVGFTLPFVILITSRQAETTTEKRPATFTRMQILADSQSKELDTLSQRVDVTISGLIEASDTINAVLAEQSQTANEQSAVITTTNTRMDALLNVAADIRPQIRLITERNDQTQTMTERGQRTLDTVLYGLQSANEQVIAIAQSIAKLTQLTRRVDVIISSVTEIATQSNLLALNASIEAARAGVNGRGFAIVAEEVRSLSQQSSNAARQVQSILAEIQKAVEATRDATQSGIEGVETGLNMAQQASTLMQGLAQSLSKTQETLDQITLNVSRQNDELDSIGINVDRIDRIAQKSVTEFKKVSHVATNLGYLASDLQQSVKMTGNLQRIQQNAQQKADAK